MQKGFVLLLGAGSLTLGSLAQAGEKSFDEQLTPLVAEYLKVHKALAADSTAGVPEVGKTLLALANKLTAKRDKAHQETQRSLRQHAATLAQATTLEAARKAFRGLSDALVGWAKATKPAGLYVMYCEMVKAHWLQGESRIRNPYHGQQMLGCGKIVQRPGGK